MPNQQDHVRILETMETDGARVSRRDNAHQRQLDALEELLRVWRLDENRFTALSWSDEADLDIPDSASSSDCDFTIVEKRAEEIREENNSYSNLDLENVKHADERRTDTPTQKPYTLICKELQSGYEVIVIRVGALHIAIVSIRIDNAVNELIITALKKVKQLCRGLEC